MRYNIYCSVKERNLILGNCVTVARQTLTLFVGVRIPIPQPKINHPTGWFYFWRKRGIGIRTRQERSGRKQYGVLFSLPWATSVSEAIAYGSARKNPVNFSHCTTQQGGFIFGEKGEWDSDNGVLRCGMDESIPYTR